MSAILLRIAIYAIIGGAIFFGIRSILRDWRNRFSDLDKQTRQRDLQERKKPGIIDLKRGDDGVFRPGDDDPK